MGGAMMRRTGLVLLSFLLVLLAIGGCDFGATDLYPAEVREYQGEYLSSISDFRENSIKGPQHVDVSDYQLQVRGLVANPQSYSYDEVLDNFASYKKVVTLYCVEGWDVRILWEGVLVSDLLEAAGTLPEAKMVIFYAYDGYSTSLSLDFIRDNDILMAYKMNELTLPPERGFPFALVAESKWGYKWIKWITEIELSGEEEYQGYWEERGYSDSGDLGEGYFD
jgi:DMSO/TMAO reductase YedYZ molybdopterin-dependent catalytic subunit